PHVQVVDRLAVDLGAEPRVGVDAVLDGTPVERRPAPDHVAQVRLGGAVLPGVAGGGGREARPLEPLAQVVEVGLGDVDGERTVLEGRRAHGSSFVVRGVLPCSRERHYGGFRHGSFLYSERVRRPFRPLLRRCPWPRRRPACSPCSACCSRAPTGPAPSSPPGSACATAPCATTSPGCASWATPSTRCGGRAAGTGWEPARASPRSCSTTPRPWPSP